MNLLHCTLTKAGVCYIGEIMILFFLFRCFVAATGNTCFSALSAVESRPTPIVWLPTVNLNSLKFPCVVSCNSAFTEVSYVYKLDDGNQNIWMKLVWYSVTSSLVS